MSHTGTVPSATAPVVIAFLDKWCLQDPIELVYSDFGYQAAMCHISAKHKAIKEGTRRVHGWALWLFPNSLLIAEHHSVWMNSDGDLVDVTPPSNGGSQILFVRDDQSPITLKNSQFNMYRQRTVNQELDYFWKGEPCAYPQWICHARKPDMVEAADKLGFDVKLMATDDQNG